MSIFDHTAETPRSHSFYSTGLPDSPDAEILAAAEMAPEDFARELDQAFGYDQQPTDESLGHMETLYREFQQRDEVMVRLLDAQREQLARHAASESPRPSNAA